MCLQTSHFNSFWGQSRKDLRSVLLLMSNCLEGHKTRSYFLFFPKSIDVLPQTRSNMAHLVYKHKIY